MRLLRVYPPVGVRTGLIAAVRSMRVRRSTTAWMVVLDPVVDGATRGHDGGDVDALRSDAPHRRVKRVRAAASSRACVPLYADAQPAARRRPRQSRRRPCQRCPPPPRRRSRSR
jgi:hypothetical protein